MGKTHCMSSQCHRYKFDFMVSGDSVYVKQRSQACVYEPIIQSHTLNMSVNIHILCFLNNLNSNLY